MKKLLIGLITVLMMFSIFGCSDKYEGLKKTEKDLFEIYVPETYKEQQIEGYDYVGYDDNTSMIVFHETISALEPLGVSENTTLEVYAELVLQANKMDNSFEMDKEGNLAIEYESDVDGEDFYYYTAVKKAEGNFFVVTCSCYKDEAENYKDEFSKWISSFKTIEK